MSIVEKALRKLQGPSLSGRPPERAPPAVDDSVPRQSLNEPIDVDLAELRREGILVPQELAERFTNEYRRVKWPLLTTALNKESGERPVPRRTLIMVASSLPKEGKSFTSVNLALSIVLERDCTILLVDADLVKPHLTRLFGLENRPGLIDVLVSDDIGPDEVIVPTNIPGLSLLPAGRPNPCAPELLASKRMEWVAERLERRNPDQIILFDSAPLLATSEPQVLARLVGQIVLVVRANSTPKVAVTEALSLLGEGKRVSLILNYAQSLFGNEYYYGDYYGYSE